LIRMNVLNFRFIYLTVFFAILFYSVHCRQSPERLVNKAENALKDQNSVRALIFFQKAFEASLPSDYFPTDRNEEYDDMVLSESREYLLLSENNKGRYHSKFTVVNLKEKDYWEKKLAGYIIYSAISPGGRYSIFLLEYEEKKCTISIWDIQARQDLPFNAEAMCQHKPGISDDGKLIFLENDTIKSFNVATLEKSIETKIDVSQSTFEKFPAAAWFQFSPDNSLFYTYGYAGEYRLYWLYNQKSKLITKSGATGRIYFRYNNNDPGIITGGADTHRITFFLKDEYNEELKNLKVSYWRDASFINDQFYYYIEEGRLGMSLDGQDKTLDFWAQKIYLGMDKEAYIISPLKHLLVYRGKELPIQAREIFQRGWDIQ